MTEKQPGAPVHRRRFALGLAMPLALGLVGLTPRQAAAAGRERALLFHHCHTGENLRTVYFADGRYLPEALRAVTHHLRDWRVNKVRPVDPALLDLLWALRRRLEAAAPIEVLSGYRTPETNALLRRTHDGVARNSLHMRGMAIDLRVPGRSLRHLHAAAVSLKGGGVGYYPSSGFVHIDSGPIRYW
jgi:uncharacterized protein YcbK (DUF882 family)